MKPLRPVLIAALLMSWATTALADDATLAIQLRLKQDGFYQGDPDGISGPMTRAAIKAYAEAHGVKTSMEAVRSQMRKVAQTEHQFLTDAQSEIAIERVKAELKDPYSADVKTHFGYMGPKGTFIVCGEVNAKNTYGAYVGFEWFAVPLMISFIDNYRALSPDIGNELVPEMCLLATSWMAALD